LVRVGSLVGNGKSILRFTFFSHGPYSEVLIKGLVECVSKLDSDMPLTMN
jgi:hypothetical protein